MKMRRLNSAMKRSEAVTFKSYSRILIKEAVAYLTALLCLSDVRDHCHTTLTNLNEILENHGDASPEIILLEWMLDTGEMRNHEATACHRDGNSSHPHEILSVFQRTNCCRRDGLIYFPICNFCIRVGCNRDTMVCSLKKTLHVADMTRNTHNWSKVHGPPA